MSQSPLLAMRGIVKRFPGVVALDGVDFTLRSGEIHALMGENGAGKSTLIKVMTGVHTADGGEILLDGQPIRPSSPQDAARIGISTVYQEVNLAPNLSVAENICLGREPKGPFGIKWREMQGRAEEALSRLGIKIDVRRPLGSYSIAIQQMAAIARALDVSAKVLVLDEPTSSLDSDEVEQLFSAMRRLRDEGMGIVFITHFLEQVYAVSDRITVLRNGQFVSETPAGDLPRLELVSQMIGRDASELEGRAEVHRQFGEEPLFLAENVSGHNSVEDVSFSIRPGEVVGLAGLLGSGRTEVVRLIFGLDQADRGRVEIHGRPARHHSTGRAIKAGFGLCPEDRKADGILPGLSVRENIILVLQARRGWHRPLSRAQQREISEKFIASLRISPPDAEKPINLLSGGNQQKAMLARWLAAEPQLLLLDEPTRGIDIGAKFEIMSLVDELSGKGMGFVFVSSELAEVIHTCSKVVVMRDRKMEATLTGAEINEENLMQLMAEGSQ